MRREYLLWSAVAIAVFTVGATLNVALSFHHHSLLFAQGAEIEGTLMVTNNDGYYHLAEAQRFAETSFFNFMSLGHQSLLLAQFLAVLGGSEVLSLLSVSSWVGPALGLTMLLGLLPWCVHTRSVCVSILAPLIALLSPYWIERTHAGVLDTDVLVPCLVYLALYSVMKFSTVRVRRWLWLILYMLIMVFFGLWWKPGVFLCVGCAGCYLLYWPRQKVDIICKYTLLGFGGTCIGLALIGVKPFVQYKEYLLSHMDLAFGASAGSLLSDAIMELHRLNLYELGEHSLGNSWLLFVVVIGMGAYGYQYRWNSLFLLVAAFAFGAVAMLSQRFLILFIPAASFFCVYGVLALCRCAGKLITDYLPMKQAVLNVFLFVLVSPVVLSGVVAHALKYEPKPYFSRADYDLAEKIRTEFPADTLIWTWWDFGYFFKFFTRMDVFFHGGSQTESTCFIAAYPLMQDDLNVAATWMKHFSYTPVSQLAVSRRGEEWPTYLAGYLAKEMKGGQGKSRPVALCLPARVYKSVGYLYSFSHVFDDEIPPVVNRLDLFPMEDFQYKPSEGIVVVPASVVEKGYEGFGTVFNAKGLVPKKIELDSLPPPYLVYSSANDFLAVTDSSVVQSVLFRLLGLFDGDSTLFEPVAFDFRTGGIWRVH